MEKLFKAIKSLFSKKKHSYDIDHAIKINRIYNIIMNQVRLVNIKCYKYLFSIIPTEDNVIIKCQPCNNIYNSITLSLMHCCILQEDELINHINKQLEALIKEAKYNFNCYKTNKSCIA